jgi:hypothetical protein
VETGRELMACSAVGEDWMKVDVEQKIFMISEVFARNVVAYIEVYRS